MGSLLMTDQPGLSWQNLPLFFSFKEHFNPCIFQELLSCLFVISLLPDHLKPFAFHWNLKAAFNYNASSELK